MTSNETKSVYKSGENAITKDDLVKSVLNIGAWAWSSPRLT